MVFIFFTPLPLALTSVCLNDHLAFWRKTHRFSNSQELLFSKVCEGSSKYYLRALFIFVDLLMIWNYMILYSRTRHHHHFPILLFSWLTQYFHYCSMCILHLWPLFRGLSEFGSFWLVLAPLDRTPQFINLEGWVLTVLLSRSWIE